MTGAPIPVCIGTDPPVGPDVDALVHAPTAGVASDATRTNWASGLPAVTGSFANNQGDPTSAIVAGDYSAILGGEGNLLDAVTHSFIGAGDTNRITGTAATSVAQAIVGGQFNVIDATQPGCSILGGLRNTITGTTGVSGDFRGRSTIVGGADHAVSGHYSVIAGGSSHTIIGSIIGVGSAHSAFIGGGFGHTIGFGSERSAIIGGQSNTLSGMNDTAVCGVEFSTFSSGNGQNFFGGGSSMVNTGGTNSAIIGGTGNSHTAGSHSAILAGFGHTLSGGSSVIAGGSGSIVSDGSAFACSGGDATTGVAGTFAHGTGLSNRVGFRGLVPAPVTVLAPIPAPTGIPGLDAWIASVDAALKTQGLAS